MDGITLDTIRGLHDWLDIINHQSNTAGIRNRNQPMTPYKHAQSSAQKWGGQPEDYIVLHDWFDETKQYTGDWTHRALRHHSAGIQWSIEKFGHCITNSKGQKIPTKILAEQHLMEDCGFIPTPQDYLSPLKLHPKQWMLQVGKQTKTQTLEIK